MASLILRMMTVYLEEFASVMLRAGANKSEVIAALAREVRKVPGVTRVNPDALKEIVTHVAHQIGQLEITSPVLLMLKHLI